MPAQKLTRPIAFFINAFYLFAFLLFVQLFTSSASAQQTDNKSLNNSAMLVLDASGSMWGQIDGKAKITIAKSVVSEIVEDWDKDTPLGLIAYGHRRKTDCSDIEVLQTANKINKSDYLNKIERLKPKGKTPLTASVQKAAEQLNYTKKKATIILISDGKETCNLDPCAIGRSLKGKGIDLTTHVISFDVKESETKGLRCLARETGGIYLAAKNASELKKALSETRKLVTDKSTLKISDASVNAPKEVVAGSKFNVAWTGPKNQQDIIIIRSLDQKKSYDYQYIGREENKSPAEVTAPEKLGEFNIYYQLSDKRTLAKTAFKVIAAAASVKTKPTITAGSSFEVEWTGPRNQFDNVTVFDTKNNKQLSYHYTFREKDRSPSSLTAPENPGEYEIRYYTYGKNTLAKQTIKVIKALATVSAPKEVTAGSAFAVEWTGPRNEFDNITLFDTNKNKKLDYHYAFRKNDQSPTSITAPEIPGEYEVRYYTYGKKTLAKQIIKVVAAKASISAPKEITAGSAFPVKWTGPRNEFDNITVFDTNKNKKLDYHYAFRENDQSPTSITAPEIPGEYEVRYYTYGKKTLAKQIIKVVAAKASVNAPEEVTAGSEFSVAWTGPRNKFDKVTLFDTERNKQFGYQYVFRKNDQSPSRLTAPEKPGEYQIRYYTNGKNTLAQQPITVIAAHAEISAEKRVNAGSEFQVSWKGPKNKFDAIAIFDLKKNRPINSQYVFRENQRSPTTLVAPKEPGNYEVRYYTYGKNTLASQAIEVSAQ